jgi:type II secretory pathway pseudopilin PulG
MYQQMTGFTLLESVLTLTLSSITAATAFSYLNDWTDISQKVSLQYNQQVAAYSMQTHHLWAKAEGRETPSWDNVLHISGIEHKVSPSGQLKLITSSGNCLGVSPQGQLSSC